MHWVVVAQLAEWSLPTPEVRGSTPVFYIEHLFTDNCIDKIKIEKKRPQTQKPVFIKKCVIDKRTFCKVSSLNE